MSLLNEVIDAYVEKNVKAEKEKYFHSGHYTYKFDQMPQHHMATIFGKNYPNAKGFGILCDTNGWHNKEKVFSFLVKGPRTVIVDFFGHTPNLHDNSAVNHFVAKALTTLYGNLFSIALHTQTNLGSVVRYRKQA